MSTIDERRRAPRVSVSLVLNVVLKKGKAHYVLETKNVSNWGLCFSSERVFPVGTQLHLVFGRSPDLPPLTAEGIVKWSEDGKGFGVEFTSISPNDQLTLLKFLNSQLTGSHSKTNS